MFWNKISPVYDLFENIYNRKVYKGTGVKVSEFITGPDRVLECACGTGAITVSIAKNCRDLVATDFAEGMLKRAAKKCRKFFEDKGYANAEYHVVEGRMPCAIAVITKL
jgi:ubiquinone/menaquinone biosynthesis C-methylase UbiE